VPSLISVWSTAPLLLNNSLGPFDSDPSVAARVRVFDASIEQLLWPEKREHDSVLGDKVPGTIDRTTQRSEVTIPAGYVPEALRAGGDIALGPIPKDVPVGLLANLRLRAESDDPAVVAKHAADLAELVLKLKLDLLSAAANPNASDEDLRARFANLEPTMLRLSKCPDFVVNRGHYFGTAQFNQQDALSADEKAFGREPELSDDDKHALIAFLKTF